MKTSVAVFHDHADAMKAVNVLKEHTFPLKKVSILGQAGIKEELIKEDGTHAGQNIPVLAGAVAGPVIGILTGIGIFAIPGFGFLYGAGAAIGFMAGLEVGVASGGLITLLMTMGFKDEHAKVYETHIKEGKYLVIVKGSQEEVDLAKNILHDHNMDMKHTHH